MAASTSTLPLKPLTIAQEGVPLFLFTILRILISIAQPSTFYFRKKIDHIIEARALNDERAIRKTLRNILTLERRALQSAASKDVEITLPGEGVPKAEEKEKDKETYALFGGELKNVELHVKKAGVVGKMEARMRETYAAKGKEIGSSPFSILFGLKRDQYLPKSGLKRLSVCNVHREEATSTYSGYRHAERKTSEC